ncbi:unnamed protein product [Chrysodeixis includens]|uniref:Uncharacterized protein n=1 Tax=Chrysodeixis includens TaxID=689277 RepID=A0A9P0FRD2_CHRIL|nr:unnamed protein product [Chrysodeixis includens]
MSRNWAAACKIWKRCTLKKSDGSALNVCFIEWPRDRTEELVNFQMTQYVPRELTYRISGLPYNEEAMKEYRGILKHILSDHAIFPMVCCEEKDSNILPNIIASDVMKLVKRGDPRSDGIPPNLKTKEVREYCRILRDWNNLYPIPSLMEKFDLEIFYDDLGCGVHSDYSGYDIAYHVLSLRRDVCQARGVPMTGAWMSSIASDKATTRAGWEEVYAVTREDLEKVLNLSLESGPSIFKYKLLRV